MARYGVLGGIHGNREALEAALAALEERGIERFLCVGDIVGYNADPDDCVSLIYGRRCATIAGNDDLISTRRLGFSRCSNKAMYALKRTRRELRPASAEWLRALPAQRVIDGDIVLVHDKPGNLRADFPAARFCFFGHSHEQKVYQVDGEQVRDLAFAGPELRLDRKYLYFINPGSVDASRKATGRFAEFAILDTTAGSIELLRTRYDAASTEIKAGMGGYRIGPWTDRAYTLHRRAVSAARRLMAAASPLRAAAASPWWARLPFLPRRADARSR